MSPRILSSAVIALITFVLPPFTEAETKEARRAIDGAIAPTQYFVVENGQNDQDFIQIANGKATTRTANYSVVLGGGTASDPEDFHFPSGSATLGPDEAVNVPITVFAEDPPHFNVHETFEIMARVVAYGSWSEGDSIEERFPILALDRLGYRVQRVLFGAFGFQAYGLSSDETFTLRVEWSDGSVVDQEFRIYDLDRQPILAIRGSKGDLQDFFTDLDPHGIGYDPFDKNKAQVEKWLREVSDPENGELDLRPHITGHSLGGAMTQWFAASYTEAGGLLGQIVSFNPPGIPDRNDFGQGAWMFKPDQVASVTHYITSADIVSLVGEKYLQGRPSQAEPFWVKSSYRAKDSVLPGNSKYKHSVPVLAPFYDDANDQRFVNLVEVATPFRDSVAVLNDPDFGFVFSSDPDVDYMQFLLWVAKLHPELGPTVSSSLLFRHSAEQTRVLIGDVLFNLPPFVETPELLRAWQSAQKWTIRAWLLVVAHGRLLRDQNLLLHKTSASSPGNFWEVAPHWPEGAWAASESWQDFAWEVMCGQPCDVQNGWTPEQWESTLDASFPWEDTVNWSRATWESYKHVPTDLVSIVSPGDGESVPVAHLVRINVSAPTDAQHVELQVSGPSGNDTLSDDAWPWELSWTPSVVGTYTLRALATLANGTLEPSKKTITVYVDPSAPSIHVLGSAFVGQETSVRVEAPDAASVQLLANGVALSSTGRQGSSWYFSWLPQAAGDYVLEALADGRRTSVTVNVIDPGKNELFVELLKPELGATVPTRRVTSVGVGAYLPVTIELRITDPTGEVSVQTTEVDRPDGCDDPCYANQGFSWSPATPGDHHLQAFVWSPNGLAGWTENRLVHVADVDEIITISEDAFLVVIPGLRSLARNPAYGYPRSHDTALPTKDYACGVVGFEALGGDIGEELPHSDIIDVYLRPSEGTWRLVADFNTWNHQDIYEWDRPETWEVTVLCISTRLASTNGEQAGKPFFVQHLPKLGDNIDTDTGIDIDDYACGVVGLASGRGDIEEHNEGDIIQVYAYRKSGTWHVRANFRTNGNLHEDWTIDLLCAATSIASPDGPAPSKPYFFEEFYELGDNVGPKRPFSTGIPTDQYVCGVVGFATLGGDIDEHKKKSTTNLISAYLYDHGGEWHVRADFRTHRDSENWNVNVFCAQREGARGSPWNVSQEEQGRSNSCLGHPYVCQVLRDEDINLTGIAVLVGGGVSGKPTARGLRCDTLDHIEVYVNDRDPATGKPRWSTGTCKLSGDTINLVPGRTYDLRGASIAGATTIPFELRDPDAAPENFRAFPRLFTGTFEPGKAYGPGIALTWRPTVHPEAKYYEIQVSEDGGANWSTYHGSRDVSIGGWINHHGNLFCGVNFYQCLKRRQPYSYRVRVLRADKSALTEWSDVVTRTSFDWPAHVELTPPSPPGPYPAVAEVTLSASPTTYGQGLRLEWGFVAFRGAEYTILSGCQSGSLSNSSVRNCELQIRTGPEPPDLKRGMKLAAVPEASVDVSLTGTDVWDFTGFEKVSLVFKKRVRPEIDAVDPAMGGVGSVITIRGPNLDGATAITFGGVSADTFTVDSSLQIRAEVPPDAKSGVIRVITPEGTATWDDRFTVVRDIPLAGADFDGDGVADHVAWNPDDGMWRVLTSSSGFANSIQRQWGTNGDIPMASDFDGDGRSDMTVWRPTNGVWYVRTSSSDWDSSFNVQWGASADLPLADTDFDGDGVADLAFWRPGDGYWHILTSSTGFDKTTAIARQWGTQGDVPLAGSDLDGDARDDMVVWRPSNGYWYTRASSTNWNGFLNLQVGEAGDIPLAGTDFDGDGRSDVAVWRPSNGYWYVRTSSSSWSSTVSRQWGAREDIPLPHTDTDGDGLADMVVWRPSNGTWYGKTSSTNWGSSVNRTLGIQGDIPLPGTDLDGDGVDDMVIWVPTLRTWCARTSSSGWAKTCVE